MDNIPKKIRLEPSSIDGTEEVVDSLKISIPRENPLPHSVQADVPPADNIGEEIDSSPAYEQQPVVGPLQADVLDLPHSAPLAMSHRNQSKAKPIFR